MNSNLEIELKIQLPYECAYAYCDSCKIPEKIMTTISVNSSIASLHFCQNPECKDFVMESIPKMYGALKKSLPVPKIKLDSFENYNINIKEQMENPETQATMKYYIDTYNRFLELDLLHYKFDNSYDSIMSNFSVWVMETLDKEVSITQGSITQGSIT